MGSNNSTRRSVSVTGSRHPSFVLDLGMNNGDDTDYYLRKGYGVVAVEANPSLVAAASKRFSAEIAQGRLTILHRAIWSAGGAISFFVNENNDHWSSLDLGWASRAESICREIQVEAVTLREIISDFGVPRYMKIDVEGADGDVLDQLSIEVEKPLYVSVEDCRLGYEYIEKLVRSGYSSFKLLDQSIVPSMIDSEIGTGFPLSSSGPFGEEIQGPWLDETTMFDTYARVVRDKQGRRLAPRTQWWDIHGRWG